MGVCSRHNAEVGGALKPGSSLLGRAKGWRRDRSSLEEWKEGNSRKCRHESVTRKGIQIWNLDDEREETGSAGPPAGIRDCDLWGTVGQTHRLPYSHWMSLWRVIIFASGGAACFFSLSRVCLLSMTHLANDVPIGVKT